MTIKKNFTLLSMILFMTTIQASEIRNLSLTQALEIMKNNNLELKISKIDEQIKQHEAKIAQGHNYGKLDANFQALRSNYAGNIFGFKLKSREASFGDFSFSEFDNTNPNILTEHSSENYYSYYSY